LEKEGFSCGNSSVEWVKVRNMELTLGRRGYIMNIVNELKGEENEWQN